MEKKHHTILSLWKIEVVDMCVGLQRAAGLDGMAIPVLIMHAGSKRAFAVGWSSSFLQCEIWIVVQICCLCVLVQNQLCCFKKLDNPLCLVFRRRIKLHSSALNLKIQMDKNAIRRKRYAEMPRDKKDEYLHRRRQAAAEKKKHQMPVPQGSCVASNMKKNRQHHRTQVSETVLDHVQKNVSLSCNSSNNYDPTVSNSFYQISSSMPADLGTTTFVEEGDNSNSSDPTFAQASSFHLPTGAKRCRTKKSISSRLDQISDTSYVLPDVRNCCHCGAKRFHLESTNFCCSDGEVSLVTPTMPYDLRRLLISDDEESIEFRKNIRTYNNHFAFTSLGAKYDRALTKNTAGVYTFRVQGQVYHFLESLHMSGDKPSGIQLYFYDTEEELARRLECSIRLREDTVKLLMRILNNNPYARFFKDLRDVPDLDTHRIVLNANPDLDQRRYNLPTVSQVAAIWAETGDDISERTPHVQVYSHSNTSYRVHNYYGCYDSLQYPILFSRGECGWHLGIQRANKKNKNKRTIESSQNNLRADISTICNASALLEREQQAADDGRKRRDTVSAREYYCYRLQIRENDGSMLLHTLRLLQQYVVAMYIKIETCRLDFQRKRQNEVRTDIFKGVMDSVLTGEFEGSKIGRRIILPASFVGGPRDMRRRYIDAMALVQRYGKPDIFLTITCNPYWKEIQDNLLFKEKPHDRPDLLSRIFRAKLEVLKSELMTKKIFGDVAACVYVVEFQKRGLPHAHFLLILKPEFRLLNPEAYDRIVCAELPNPTNHAHLLNLVIKHMVHGPCGKGNKSSPCMRDGLCKNHYPKDYAEYTSHAEDGYPHYRRRRDNRTVRVRRCEIDNRWIVPYNPYLLALFDCHINVEICSTLKLVKYLYKYVYKGHDLVSFHISDKDRGNEIDEIKQFQEARWIAAPESLWRIYSFNLSEMHHAVYMLQVHLKDHQFVSFNKYADLSKVLNNVDLSRTMLTEYFEMNKSNAKAVSLKCLYREFPEYFVWCARDKLWTERKRCKVIGRMATVSPAEGERYYLRLLLSHVRAPTSFDDLLTFNGKTLFSYREAALALGLLASDSYIEDTLEEASIFQMASSLRFLFAVILVFCAPNNPSALWKRYESEMSRDFLHAMRFTYCTSEQIHIKALEDINKLLEQMGKNVDDYHLISRSINASHAEQITREIQCERNINCSAEDTTLHLKLNSEQKLAYQAILDSVFSDKGQSFLIDGPGGTGKTFLYRALLATLRSQNFVAIAVATSGVAASILPGGRTAHSRFKIPLDMSTHKTCQLSKQSSTAKLIIEAKLIVWDEASMAKKEAIEAFHELLKDIMDMDEPFGGKVIVFGGDFRQTLPVTEGASKEVQIKSTIFHSPLWKTLHKFRLKENMRALLDPAFSDFLLRVGEGKEHTDEDNKIYLSSNMVIPYNDKENSLNRLIESVFSDLSLYAIDPYKMINRCILSSKNSSVHDVNELIISMFPGELHTYTSSDRTLDERYQGDYEDFLNSQNPRGLPPHKLLLKVNCPIMLMRNLNPTMGLCNGTRLICKQLGQHTIHAEIAIGQHAGEKVFIPRIPLQTSEGEKHGIPFKRTQFPVRLCFVMTINKSQGQTLEYVGLYLREPVFSHGQLYVALSRAKVASSVKVLIVPATLNDVKNDCKTRNVVFHEVLELANQ